MTTSKCIGRRVGKPFISRTAGAVRLVLLLGSGPVWAGPPDPTASDALANTAGGSNALFRNTTGDGNTAFGYDALYSNTTGGDNSASGSGALYNNTTGVENTASGFLSGLTNIAGNYNTFIGAGADANADYTNGTAL